MVTAQPMSFYLVIFCHFCFFCVEHFWYQVCRTLLQGLSKLKCWSRTSSFSGTKVNSPARDLQLFRPYRFLRAVKLNRAQSRLLYLLFKRHLLSCLVVCYELAQLLGNERMKRTGMEKGVNKSANELKPTYTQYFTARLFGTSTYGTCPYG